MKNGFTTDVENSSDDVDSSIRSSDKFETQGTSVVCMLDSNKEGHLGDITSPVKNGNGNRN